MTDPEIKLATELQLLLRLVNVRHRMDNLECRPSNFREHANLVGEMGLINAELELRTELASTN
jgi:hypothetical protein